MNRREAIKRTALLMGGTLSASTMLGVLNGCKADPSFDWTPKYLTPEEGNLVSTIAERIIPRTDTPGATDAGVHTFIDSMMEGFYGEKEKAAFREGLKKVDDDAKAANSKPFAKLTPEQQDALLTKYDQEVFAADALKPDKDAPPPFWRTMKELTLVGYFTSEPGATEFLQYDPVPGVYQGCIPLADVGGKAWAT